LYLIINPSMPVLMQCTHL